MIGDDNWIVRIQRFDDAIVRLVIRLLGNERSKHFIPDDEDTRIVGIEISRIGRVMDAVMTGRIEDGFKPARTLIDRLGVDPELIDKIDPARDADKSRVEAK